MLRRAGVGVVGALAWILSAGACSSDPASQAGDAGGADGAASCDPQKDVTCISEEKGFFVKTGSQGGDGTRAKPFAKIQEGIDAATAAKFRVYVCEGDYAETVSIKKTVGVYGGLTGCDATTWTPTVGRVSKVKAAAGYALDASAGSIELTDLSFTAPDFTGQTETTEGTAGKSSIAAFIHSGADVQAKRTSFVAQGGGNAKPTMADPSGTGAAGGMGGTADGTNVGTSGTSSCGVAGGQGGKGGSSAVVDQSTAGKPAPTASGMPGTRGCNRDVAAPAPCEGGSGACGNGRDGAGGASGAGSTPATKLGDLAAAGFTPAAGVTGGSGGNGGGAGGGGGGNSGGQNGGGGGGGGCGGTGGKGGGAGGASIAILVHDARLACSDGCAAKAGAGGTGGKGQKGQQGGTGADNGGQSGAGSCAGGIGGGGAGGQGGQGGAGGLAAGMVFGGTASVTWAGQPVADTTAALKDVAAGTPGKPGEAGDPGGPGASTGNAGSIGAPSTAGPSEATASAAKKL